MAFVRLSPTSSKINVHESDGIGGAGADPQEKINIRNTSLTLAEICMAIDGGVDVFCPVSISGGPNDGIVVDLPLVAFTRLRNGSESIPTGRVVGPLQFMSAIPSFGNKNLPTYDMVTVTEEDGELVFTTSRFIPNV